KRQVEAAWANVAAVAFRGPPPAAPPSEPALYHLVLEGGGRLALAGASLAKGGDLLKGQAAFGANVEGGLTKMIAPDVRRGPVVSLSDLEPSKYEHTPFLGPGWPLVRDGSVSGGDLKVGDSSYDKGLGTHAECRVTYDLAGKFRWLEAMVGLDPEMG